MKLMRLLILSGLASSMNIKSLKCTPLQNLVTPQHPITWPTPLEWDLPWPPNDHHHDYDLHHRHQHHHHQAQCDSVHTSMGCTVVLQNGMRHGSFCMSSHNSTVFPCRSRSDLIWFVIPSAIHMTLKKILAHLLRSTIHFLSGVSELVNCCIIKSFIHNKN